MKFIIIMYKLFSIPPLVALAWVEMFPLCLSRMPSNNEYVLPLWGENNKETNFYEGRVFYFIPKLGVDVIHFSEIIYSRPGLRREK